MRLSLAASWLVTTDSSEVSLLTCVNGYGAGGSGTCKPVARKRTLHRRQGPEEARSRLVEGEEQHRPLAALVRCL